MAPCKLGAVGMELGVYNILQDSSGVDRVYRETTVPIAIPRPHISGDKIILSSPDTTYQGVRLSQLLSDIQNLTTTP